MEEQKRNEQKEESRPPKKGIQRQGTPVKGAVIPESEEKTPVKALQNKEKQENRTPKRKRKKLPLHKKICRFAAAFVAVLGEELSEKKRIFKEKRQKKREELQKEKMKEQKASAKNQIQKDSSEKEKKEPVPVSYNKKEEKIRKKESKQQLKLLSKMEEEKNEKQTKKKTPKKVRNGNRSRIEKVQISLLAVVLAVESAAMLFVGGTVLKNTIEANPPSVTMAVVRHNTEEKCKISPKDAFPDGETRPFFSMDFLSKEMNIGKVSDGNFVYYTLGNGEQIIMKKNSHNVTVNGKKIFLSAPVRVTEDGVFVPLELITRYSNGLVVSYNREEGMLTFTREKNMELSDTEHTVYKELSFHLQKLEPAPLPEITEGNQ